MNFVKFTLPIAEPTFCVAYTRPGGTETRIGPMAEQYVRAMAQEYHRKGLQAVRLEEWGPVNAWKLENPA